MNMRHITLCFAAFSICACAHPSRYVEKGFDAAEKGMKGIDVGLDLAAEVYSEAYEANEAYCRATLGKDPTREEKDECLKAFRNADEVAQKAAQASDLYDTLVEVLTDLEKVTVDVARAAEEAKKNAKKLEVQ